MTVESGSVSTLNGKLYIISSLHNADRVRSIRDRLTRHGVRLAYDWTTHGQLYEEGDRLKAALGELQGVDEAECILMVFPGRCGSHFEMGYAYAKGKPIVILNDGSTPYDVSFHALEGLIKCDNEDEAVDKVLCVLENV